MEEFLPPVRITAIATLFAPTYADQLRRLWRELSEDCKTQLPVTRDPIPHFSWQGADSYDEPNLEAVLENLASETESFDIKTSGIGLFTKPTVVIYIAIVKNDQLIALHKKIWERTIKFAHGINPYYQPDHWIPHITIAQGLVDPTSVRCVFNKVAFHTFDWKIRVNNLAVIHAGKVDYSDKQYLFNS